MVLSFPYKIITLFRSITYVFNPQLANNDIVYTTVDVVPSVNLIKSTEIRRTISMGTTINMNVIGGGWGG